MLTFDRKQLTDHLEPLPKRLRVAFAAACAQRQLPNYVSASAANPRTDADAATRMLHGLWDAIARNAFDSKRIQRDLSVCRALLPDYDNGYFEGIEFADDAIVSIGLALDTALKGASHDAAGSAERAFSALDEYIIRRFHIDDSAPGAESLIDSFPIMQAELSRQQADLADLHAAAKNPGSEAAIIVRIKRRAESDA